MDISLYYYKHLLLKTNIIFLHNTHTMIIHLIDTKHIKNICTTDFNSNIFKFTKIQMDTARTRAIASI